ncbi:uncharacterized protein O3C94_018003 [Discoglossus pictus]
MTSGKKAVVSLDIVDAKSPANQYLVYLLEDKKTVSFQHPTEQRIRVVFEVLDKMTPQLGVFSKVLRLIRTELYDAFYSPPIQGSQVWKTSEPLPQVPYFSLMRRRQNERNEEVEKVESELHKVKTM